MPQDPIRRLPKLRELTATELKASLPGTTFVVYESVTKRVSVTVREHDDAPGYVVQRVTLGAIDTNNDFAGDVEQAAAFANALAEETWDDDKLLYGVYRRKR